MRQEYFAHSSNDIGEKELLRVHLSLVSERASEYAAAFGAQEEAMLTGLLHDIGKYGELFQKRLTGEERGIDHWSAGAWLALIRFQEKGIAPALAIQGHHLGLDSLMRERLRALDPSELAETHPQNCRLSEPDYDILLDRLKQDGLSLADPSGLPRSLLQLDDAPGSRMVDVRMLYSALVDADFTETRAFYDSKAEGKPLYAPEGGELKPDELINALNSYMDDIRNSHEGSDDVAGMREDLFTACIEAAADARGAFTLTAPTGSGKTLGLLAFALKHASLHGLRRIILVVPYLSIIEQTAGVYREALTADNTTPAQEILLEHHSLAGTRERTDVGDSATTQNTRLLAENWDAPIIITTSVQFFESLFSNRPSACRKLHRIANSVILFDEVQTLPMNVSVPTLAALSRLVSNYGCSIVFSTATQPAFEHVNEAVTKLEVSGWRPKEIVPAEMKLYDRICRTKCAWPDSRGKMSWNDIAETLAGSNYRQTLCVVNMKRHALEVFRRLKESEVDGVLHLSTSMCPLHRRKLLGEAIQRLREGKACRLVSTQCIEAGVDIDFPIVLRAMGPLDSMAQAAGRCNRNGNLNQGRVIFFYPQDEDRRVFPDATYGQATSVTLKLLAERGADGMDLNDQDLFREYYRELYNLSGTTSSESELKDAIIRGDFKDVARLYNIIDDRTINLLVPFEDGPYENLIKRARTEGINGKWITAARPHSISIFAPREDDPIVPYIEPAITPKRVPAEDWFILLDHKREHYSPEIGLVPFDNTGVLIG